MSSSSSGPPPPPPAAMSLDQATEGLFVLHEDALVPSLLLGKRRVLLWDVEPREVLLARGTIEFAIDRRIAAREVVAVHFLAAGRRSRVALRLASGEAVDLIGARPFAEAKATADLVARVTEVPIETD